MASSTPKRDVVMNVQDSLFSGVPVDETYVNSYTLTFNPSSIISGRSLTFDVPKLDSSSVMNLNGLTMAMKLKLVDKDGNKPPDNANIAPINIFPQSMWRSTRLYLNQTEVTSSDNGTYALRCYSDFNLNYGVSEKLGMLQMYGYYPDEAGTFQEVNPEDFKDNGHYQRRLLFAGLKSDGKTWEYSAKPVCCFSKIFTDFTSCAKPMIGGVGVRLEMHLADPGFSLLCRDQGAAAKGYHFEIESATLLVPVKTLAAGLALELDDKLSKGPVVYNVRRLEGKKLEVAASLQSFTTDSLTQSTVNPDRIVMFMIPQYLYEGGISFNPFESSPYIMDGAGARARAIRLSELTLSVNGVPLKHAPSDDPDQLVVSQYRQMFQSLGQLDSNNTCGISLKEYRMGYFILVWDITASLRAADVEVRQPTKSGHLRLELKWDAPLPYAMNLFSIAEYHSAVAVDKSRNVAYNYIA